MKVLYFAQARNLADTIDEEMNLPNPLSLEEVWDLLIQRHPSLITIRPNTRISRNHEFASTTTRFQNEDEIALIPPVSGG